MLQHALVNMVDFAMHMIGTTSLFPGIQHPALPKLKFLDVPLKLRSLLGWIRIKKEIKTVSLTCSAWNWFMSYSHFLQANLVADKILVSVFGSLIVMQGGYSYIRTLISWLRLTVKTTAFKSYRTLLSVLLRMIRHCQFVLNGKERSLREQSLALSSQLVTNQDGLTASVTLAVPRLPEAAVTTFNFQLPSSTKDRMARRLDNPLISFLLPLCLNHRSADTRGMYMFKTRMSHLRLRKVLWTVPSKHVDVRANDKIQMGS
ncbi:uncharacterized protein BJ212DRAFT_659058 [Suillus subaureus]|uniref:Uncharacterized protein n=1 Tax=Suillus subaureus TaxID=48587 RepID=A0A9P7DIR3_9AGAM|nr:uncharacterized protein BJ212DRAFT_659058 [Suillus subaureus]KAG1794487.1 hypothetical protein BJ212DRAFT_659058 [Suillus subaureus]